MTRRRSLTVVGDTISWRTQLIEDPEVLAQVEADLAEVACSFGSLSVSKLEAAIDAAITVHDPAAVRREQTAARGCIGIRKPRRHHRHHLDVGSLFHHRR